MHHNDQPSNWRAFLILVVFPVVQFWAVTAAAQKEEMYTSADIRRLSDSIQWRALLQYDRRGRGSINQSSYYIAGEKGRLDPYVELMATLAALDLPVEDSHHPRCRFPARYYWLSRELKNPRLSYIPEPCHALKTWIKKFSGRKISYVFVSNYMSNPASVFGHGFISIGGGQINILLGDTLSYGAHVPDNEFVLSYIYRGLTGGYEGVYRDQYFYQQDLSYGAVEDRDMWKFVLRLSPSENELFMLHIWEIRSYTKPYYFLNGNCVYEMGRFVQAATGERIVPDDPLWFLPRTLFVSLVRKGLVSQVEYMPSLERSVVHAYKELDTDDQKAALNFLRHLDDNGGRPGIYGKEGVFSPLEQRLSDFVLSYLSYLEIKIGPDEFAKKGLGRVKRRALLARLALPPVVRKGDDGLEEKRPSPTDLESPYYVEVGYEGVAGFKVSTALYSQEIHGVNELEGDQIQIGRITASYEKGIEVRFIDILHLGDKSVPWRFPLSWGMNLSWENSFLDENAKFLVFDGMVGTAKRVNNETLFFLFGPSIFSLEPFWGSRMKAGVLFRLGENARLLLSVDDRRIWQKKRGFTQDTWTSFSASFHQRISQKWSVELRLNQLDNAYSAGVLARYALQ